MSNWFRVTDIRVTVFPSTDSFSNIWAVFFNIGSAILDLVKLGATQFTLMFGANSAAKETVNPSTAAFADRCSHNTVQKTIQE